VIALGCAEQLRVVASRGLASGLKPIAAVIVVTAGVVRHRDLL